MDQVPCMPGDLLRILRQQIRWIEYPPELLVPADYNVIALQQFHYFVFTACQRPVGIGGFAAKLTPRCPEQIFQQFAFPRVPYFWAGAAYIRDREQIKRNQAPLVTHLSGEIRNHVWVGYVFLLRG